MLALPHTNSWGFVYTNQDAGATTFGTSVVPGASDVEGTFTEIAPDTSITADIYFAEILVSAGASSGQSKMHLLDVAYDPTGGTTYDRFLFSNFVCGGTISPASFSVLAGTTIRFPCKIPAGSAIAARVQGSNATAGTVRVLGKFYGKPSRPELWRPAAYSETLGYSSGTLGTSVTPGSAAWGTWTSIGTTTKKHFWAQLGVQIDNNTQSAHGTHYQLGIGDGTNMHVICDTYGITGTGEQQSMQPHDGAWEIPAGATLYVRANNSAAPVTGYNATCVLFGG